jgi:hypothetical protein
VDLGVAPRNERAVHPDEPVAIMKRNKVGHPSVILPGLYRWRVCRAGVCRAIRLTTG